MLCARRQVWITLALGFSILLNINWFTTSKAADGSTSGELPPETSDVGPP
jgi:hypothetical protein